MRLIYLEIKRVLSSRIALISVLAAIIFSALLAYIPVTFAYCYDPLTNDYKTGFDAIESRWILREEAEGEITEKDIQRAILEYQRIMTDYGVSSLYELPDEARYDLEPVTPFLHLIEEAYAREDGIGANIMDMSADNLPDFYEACRAHLENTMDLEDKNHPASKEAALNLYEKVEKPFIYYYGISSNAVEYQGILILLVLFSCVVVCAPVFSIEYQTGSDNILRCTKYGRKELGIGKIFASLIISITQYLICMGIWMGLSLAFWGAEGMKTSIQVLFTVIGLLNCSVGQLLLFVAAFGIIMLASGICLTLFISTKVQNTMISLTVSFLAVMAPIVMSWFLPDWIANYAKVIFPTGGIGLNNGFLYDLIDFRFLNIGRAAIWSPYLIVAFALLEIPLWYFLAVRRWARRT